MSDLNDIYKFEKELNNLVQSRSNLKSSFVDVNSDALLTGISEEQKRIFTTATYMVVPEHGQPFRSERVEKNSSYRPFESPSMYKSEYFDLEWEVGEKPTMR